MSSKALEWARTQEFENSTVVRTAILRFLAEQADDDGYIPDHEGDKGVAFIMHETCASKSTVIRALKDFEKADLLHRERRAYADFGGRQTDLIILHLWNLGTKTPWRTLKTLKQLHKSNQARFGVPIEDFEAQNEAVDNSSKTQGVTLTLSGDSAPNTQGVTLTPSGGLGVTLTQARCHSDINDTSALIGTRARTSPKTSPISQSVKEEPVVENPQTDGLTEKKKKNIYVNGVDLNQLRRELEKALKRTLLNISDEVLALMVKIVIARASGTVKSPQRFAFVSISKEFEATLSLAESVKAEEVKRTQPEQVAPVRKTCQAHNQDFTSEECPYCRSERIAASTQTQEQRVELFSPDGKKLTGPAYAKAFIQQRRNTYPQHQQGVSQ